MWVADGRRPCTGNLLPELSDLRDCLAGSAGIIDGIIGFSSFFLEGELKTFATSDVVDGPPPGLTQARASYPGRGFDVYDDVTEGFEVTLQQQGRIDDDDGRGVSAAVERAGDSIEDGRMKETFELTETGGGAEDDAGQFGAVDSAVVGEDGVPVALTQGAADGGKAEARVSDHVGVDHAGAEVGEGVGDGGLAAADPSNEADDEGPLITWLQASFLRRRRPP